MAAGVGFRGAHDNPSPQRRTTAYMADCGMGELLESEEQRQQRFADERRERLEALIEQSRGKPLDRELAIELFNGGPVGLSTLAAALSEEIDAIEDVYEPFLLQLGFLQRTPRGRITTRRAYEHLGIPFIEKLNGESGPEQGRLW